jgi:Na+-translocating ferredoxin:NAD+ oxidoreductase RnfD subunit
MKKSEKISVPYIVVLTAIAVVSIFYYGFRVLLLLFIAMLAGVVTEIVCLNLKKQKYNQNMSSVLSEAVILTFMMPASINIGILIISEIFATAFGRHIFGSGNKKLIPPPVLGYVFALAGWKKEVLSYPEIIGKIGYFSFKKGDLSASSSAMFNSSGVFNVSDYNILVGNTISSLGTGVIGLLIICAVVLLISRKIRISPLIGFVVSISFFGSIVCKSGDYLVSAKYEILANMVIFSAVFLVSDKESAPEKFVPGLLYGLTLGMVTYYFTFFTEQENAVIPAMIICIPIALLCRSYDGENGKKTRMNEISEGEAV